MLAVPEMLASAATDLEGIGTTLNAANAAAEESTSGLLAAAGDEVSAAAAALFNAHGQEYQAVMKQAAAFHSDFTQALATAGNAYAEAEAVNTAAVSKTLSTANTVLKPLLEQTAGSLIDAGETGTGGVVTKGITALVMGGTGNPLPNAKYLADIDNKFIQPLFPGARVQGLTTPEQFWPATPRLGNLSFNQSVAQGVTALTEAVNTELALGNKVVVFGYSQSATIVNNYINSLIATGAPHVDNLSFVTLASPNTPNGGILARFPGLNIPFLDVSFNGATPPNNPYPTHMYTYQYDIVANAPRYPLNVFSSLNALMGFAYAHPAATTTAAQVANAVLLPTSPGYMGNTQYYMIPNQNLPLLQPIRDIPYLGPVLADFVQPPLRVLVDLGYGSYGAGLNYANIPTPAGLLSIPNPLSVPYYLALGSLQGPYGALIRMGVEAGLLSPDLFPNTYPWVPSLNPGLNIPFDQLQLPPLPPLQVSPPLLSDDLEEILRPTALAA